MTEAKVAPPAAAPPAERQEAAIFVASQWKLVWWRFRRHRVAMVSGMVVILLYTVALFPEFLAPFSSQTYDSQLVFAPPHKLHLLERTEQGLVFRPYVNAHKYQFDAVTLKRTYTVDETKKIPLGLFVRGEPYKLLGVFAADVHLWAPLEQGELAYLLGADRMGRDMLSRLIYGTRISLSIGLVGVAMSLVLGILLGGISGYYGGTTDNLIQRIIEFLRSVPSIPLWLGLAAALPPDWPPLSIYFGITLILSVVGWTGMARVVRGRFLAMREEDFVLAARLDGASELRIILRHMVPSFLSHIIASVTLSIPGMILSETALSFLGLGLRPPVVSWGVLLQGAQNVHAVAVAPWLLVSAPLVVIAVLSLNFLGDGLRDAADPYAR